MLSSSPETVSLADLSLNDTEKEQSWGKPPSVTPLAIVSQLAPLNTWHGGQQPQPVQPYQGVSMHNRTKSWSPSTFDYEPPPSNYSTSATQFNYYGNNPHSHPPNSPLSPSTQSFNYGSYFPPAPYQNPHDPTVYTPHQQQYANTATGIYQTYAPVNSVMTPPQGYWQSPPSPPFQHPHRPPVPTLNGRNRSYSSLQAQMYYQQQQYGQQQRSGPLPKFGQNKPHSKDQTRSRSQSLGIVNYPEITPIDDPNQQNGGNKLQGFLSKVNAKPFVPSNLSEGGGPPSDTVVPTMVKRPSMGIMHASVATYRVLTQDLKNVVDKGFMTTYELLHEEFGCVSQLSENVLSPECSATITVPEKTEIIHYITLSSISSASHNEVQPMHMLSIIPGNSTETKDVIKNASESTAQFLRFHIQASEIASITSATRLFPPTLKRNKLYPMIVPYALSKGSKKGQLFMGVLIEKLLKSSRDLYFFSGILDGSEEGSCLAHRPMGPNRKVLVHIVRAEIKVADEEDAESDSGSVNVTQELVKVRVNEKYELDEGETLCVDKAAITDRIEIHPDVNFKDKIEVLVLDVDASHTTMSYDEDNSSEFSDESDDYESPINKLRRAYDYLKVADLRGICMSWKLSPKGPKPDLIDRIVGHEMKMEREADEKAADVATPTNASSSSSTAKKVHLKENAAPSSRTQSTVTTLNNGLDVGLLNDVIANTTTSSVTITKQPTIPIPFVQFPQTALVNPPLVTPPISAIEDDDKYAKMTLPELKAICRTRGLPVSGTKSAVRERILANDAGQSPGKKGGVRKKAAERPKKITFIEYVPK
ncbi:hypothetical protein HK098_001103 [Nowakowskiella sp. JEL0407]|nr:hypothetical protein HK098_001103 [Nowakowskiella sp. JEL0407]